MTALLAWLIRWWKRTNGCGRGRHQGMGSPLLGRYRLDACEVCGRVFDVRG